jgi:glycosyltransferase involved in cell wall biosynthesis
VSPSRSRRKILLVLEATLGGTGRHILGLARGFLERNDEVHLVYSLVRADAQFKAGLKKLRADYPSLGECVLPIRRPVVPADAYLLWKMYRYSRRHGPFDIIHGHSTKAGFLSRLLPDSRAAKIYTPHGLMTLDPSLKGFRRWAVCNLEALLSRLSKRIIVLSEEERHCALVTGIESHKLVLIENGIDLARFARGTSLRTQLRESFGLSPECPCIGWVGRLCEQKEPSRLLDAFAVVNEKTSGRAKLVVVGSGSLEPALKTKAQNLGIDKNVIWAGGIDGADHMSMFDVLAHSSRMEGFGYVFLEALASGVPIVTTRGGGAAELVEPTGAGFICDPWHPETFAGLLIRVLEDANLRASMSEAGRRSVSRFDIVRMLDLISDVYDSVAPGPLATKPRDLRAVPDNSR